MSETIRQWLLPHYLLHILIDGVHSNAVWTGGLGSFVAKMSGKRIVLVSAWRLSRTEYRRAKLAIAAAQIGKTTSEGK